MRYSFILVVILSFIFTSNTSFAGELSERFGRTGYLKKDRFDEDRTNIFDQDGSRKGYLEQDNFYEDRINIYNH